jgi:hypothetical protein
MDQPIREARADELHFVLATWTNSHAYQLHRYERARAMPSFRRFISDVLETAPRIVVWYTSSEPETKTRLFGSATTEHPKRLFSQDTLHGWACAAPGERLYYAYLPKELRGRGLSRALVREAFGEYPKQIPTAYPWPHAGARFQFTPWKRAA